MIRSFYHRGLKQFFINQDKKLLNSKLISRIERLLDALDTSLQIEDMNFGSNHLHKLKGDRKDIWSVWVSGNWRITFRFEEGHAYDVNLEDYH